MLAEAGEKNTNKQIKRKCRTLIPYDYNDFISIVIITLSPPSIVNDIQFNFGINPKIVIICTIISLPTQTLK